MSAKGNVTLSAVGRWMRISGQGDLTRIIAPNTILADKGEKWFTTLRTGAMQEVSINLPKIALSTKAKDDTEFFNRLDEALEAAKAACAAKKATIERRLHPCRTLRFLSQDFGNGEYYQVENSRNVVNVVGIDNAVKEYTGMEIGHDAGALQFTDRILGYINRKLENYNQEGLNLALGVLLSLFTAIIVTRTYLHLVLDNLKLDEHPNWFGL